MRMFPGNDVRCDVSRASQRFTATKSKHVKLDVLDN